MTALGKALVALVVLLLVVAGVQTWRLVSAERALAAERMAPHTEAVRLAQVRVDTVEKVFRVAERVVTRELTKVRVETLTVAPPQTQAETITVVQRYPVLVAAYDTLQRACSVYLSSCQTYRTASEARDSAQRALITTLEFQALRLRPSRGRSLWERIDGPLLFAGGVYLGLQAR